MTNEERIIKEIVTTKALAAYLVSYNECDGLHYTSDGNAFYWKKDAIAHEIEWLKSEEVVV